MSKKLVTCTARSPRGVNAFVNGKDEKGGVESVILNPSESRDLALVDEEHPALVGMVEAREIVIGDEELEPLTEEEEEERQAEVFRNDPIQRMTRESAEAAGRTEGLASPPPRERGGARERTSTTARGGRKGRAKATADEE